MGVYLNALNRKTLAMKLLQQLGTGGSISTALLKRFIMVELGCNHPGTATLMLKGLHEYGYIEPGEKWNWKLCPDIKVTE